MAGGAKPDDLSREGALLVGSQRVERRLLVDHRLRGLLPAYREPNGLPVLGAAPCIETLHSQIVRLDDVGGVHDRVLWETVARRRHGCCLLLLSYRPHAIRVVVGEQFLVGKVDCSSLASDVMSSRDYGASHGVDVEIGETSRRRQTAAVVSRGKTSRPPTAKVHLLCLVLGLLLIG